MSLAMEGFGEGRLGDTLPIAGDLRFKEPNENHRERFEVDSWPFDALVSASAGCRSGGER